MFKLICNSRHHSYIFKLIKILALIFLFQIGNVKATDIISEIPGAKEVGDVVKTTLDELKNITCETRNAYDLFRSEFSHTCTPAPFFSLATASVIGIGTYLPMVLKLNMVNDDLFKDKFPGGQCLKVHRADPKDPKINFGLCSNTKLATSAVVASTKMIENIATAALSGENVWEGIKKAWDINPKDYFELKEMRVGESDVFVDINLAGSPVIPYQVVQVEDRICVAVRGPFGGPLLNVGCKYIREPCPRSIYSDFVEGRKPSTDLLCEGIFGSGKTIADITTTDPTLKLVECTNATECYERANKNSKTIIPITGAIIECLKQMIDRLLINSQVCPSKPGSVKLEDSNFYRFQTNMQRIVSAFLTLYIIFWGFNILFSGGEIQGKNMVNNIIKIVLVTYFSIGINMSSGGVTKRFDGMTQWVFPLLLNTTSEIVNWVTVEETNTSGQKMSGLCNFEPKEYPIGQKHLAFWDKLDCYITHCLGIDFIKDVARERIARIKDWKNSDPFGFSIPPYYFLLIPAFITGNMTLVMLAISYPLMVISVAAYMVNSFVVCMIGILIMGILAPIFVPMVLFEYTKSYFQQWLKLLISFVLQPMVVAIFMMTMFSVYKYGFYTNCQYQYKEIEEDYGSGQTRTRKMFFIDVTNKRLYGHGNDADRKIKQCKKSLGWMLNNPMFATINAMSSVGKIVLQDTSSDKTYDDTKSEYGFLSDGLQEVQGFFFKSTQAIFQAIKELILSLITACFTLYLMYHLSAKLSTFAAEMTEGIDLSGVTINPQTIYKTVSSAVNMAASQAGQQGGAKAIDNKGGGGNSHGSNRSGSIGGNMLDGAGSIASSGIKGSVEDANKMNRAGDMVSKDSSSDDKDKES